MDIPEGILPRLNWHERVLSWFTQKERLLAEVNRYKRRLNALMCARDEAISNALLFENEDIMRWLRGVSSSEKGALAIRLKESQERVRELERTNASLAPSKAAAWETLNSVLEAWEIASQTKVAHWDKEKKEWVPVVRDEVLPQEVLDALKTWINRDRKGK